MKILAIRINNLASLEGTTELNFTQEPLCSAGIFAITGPTGAGKSTILDALCIALYARTPRYRFAENGIEITDVKGTTIKQDDVRGILRDGTSSGYAEVDFVGVDEQQYRSVWSVKRAYNKTDGNLQPYEMALKNITANQIISGRKTELLLEIERLVGLSFEQFTRSVLLAQGDFTAFMKASKDEKSSLLEKLTGTNVYSEISKKVFENYREQQQKFRELNVQCEGIATFTVEELHILQVQKEILETKVKSFEQQIANLNREITWHGQYLKLQEGVESARVQYEQANTDKTEAQSRGQKLHQIYRIQPVRPVIGKLQNLQEQIAINLKQSEELTANLLTLQQHKQLLDIAIGELTNDLNAKTQEEENARPLLDEAKALDVQLSEKTEQIKQAAAEVTIAFTREKQQKELFFRTQEESDILQREIIKLDRWKSDNTVRQPVADQESMILSRLGDAHGMLESLKHYRNLNLKIEEEIEKNQQEKQGLDNVRESVQNLVQQKQRDYQTLQTVSTDISIQDLEKEKGIWDALVEDIIAAEAHWKLLSITLTEKETVQVALKSNKKELEQYIEKFKKAEQNLKGKRAERDTSLKMLEKARLIAAENVEHLRNQLEPAEPCPVCGSTSHPYVVHHPGLEHILSELEANYSQAEADYTNHLASYSSLDQACKQIRKIITTQKSEIVRRRASLQELEKTWSAFQIYEKCEELPVEERANWLRQQLKELKIKQQQLQEQIQAYTRRKEQLEMHKMNLAELDKQLNVTENQIKDINRSLKSLQEQKANYAGEQQKARSRLDDVRLILSAFFPSEQWFQNWQANPEAFAKRIKSFAGEWKTNLIKLEENSRQQSVLAEKLKGMQEQANNIGEEMKLKEQKLSELQLQSNCLSDKRKSIFKGEPALEVERKLKQSVNTVKLNLEQQRKEAEKLQGGITHSLAQNEQLGKDKLALSKQENGSKKQLEEWLDNYNQQNGVALAEAELLNLLEFTQDWIEMESNSLRRIDDAVMQAKSVLDERISSLEIHSRQRLSEKTPEELAVLKADAQALLNQNIQAANEIDFKIKEDVLNKKRIGHLLQEIEKQGLVMDNWAKLNDIIGSADGKKFRQIAQEFTLDVLLSYANIHLEGLSKRYVLQRIPNTLGLQVIDQDMGDEVRTVYSLSGGESFLAALALALGLASLSSSRMKVESLFIDEGFGSLDPATLNIAMDALERLHNQGRKVGVISHVQEMTERIPVQIRVRKQQSGRSKVEVTAF